MAVTAADLKFAWDANKETNITHYNFYAALQGGAVTTNKVTSTNHVFTTPGPGTYSFWVTAVNDAHLESPASDIVKYSSEPPPQVNIISRSVARYDSGANAWLGFRLDWTPVNLEMYGARSYELKVRDEASTNAVSIILTPKPFYSFNRLPVGNYEFEVSIKGSAGKSPEGTRYVQ